MYDTLETEIKEVVKIVRVRRSKEITDDKLSDKTKKLLEKRTNLNKKSQKTTLERIELSELKKINKKRNSKKH